MEAAQYLQWHPNGPALTDTRDIGTSVHGHTDTNHRIPKHR
jgi:hypothetical protein